MIPEVVRNRAIAIDRVHDDGTEAFVADAVLDDGTPAVLKVLVPRRGGGIDDHEATVLRLAGGDGCPALYRDGPERAALLMERLGPSMFALGLPYEQRLPRRCDAAARVWRPAPDAALPTTVEKARGWSTSSSRPGPPSTGPARSGRSNTLSSAGVGGSRTPAATSARSCSMATSTSGMRCGPGTASSSSILMDRSIVERVSTGLVATRIGLQPVGGELLALADRLAAQS